MLRILRHEGDVSAGREDQAVRDCRPRTAFHGQRVSNPEVSRRVKLYRRQVELWGVIVQWIPAKV